ncbi:MAG: EF2563 family selenium-dependent molybdenum hydroxylase system protein [Deltaproteobacteria bacterium]|nr:EF2563 family selenium-dependent molybdenum hydroxylase system protein [Deltaproteobacteria bacterium]
MKDLVILVLGAGEMASATAHRLFRCHFKLLLTEIEEPLAVRRAVSFCEAVYEGSQTVEGVTAVRIDRIEDAQKIRDSGRLPILVQGPYDPPPFRPDVIIDATLRKHNFGLTMDDASMVIALGPGFTAGNDVHVVVETNRGHNLGRLIFEGTADPDTGVPGSIAGYDKERVLRSPAEGIFMSNVRLGDRVEQGQEVAEVAGKPVTSAVSGVLRGLIRPGIRVSKGMKVGDVDPRGDIGYLSTISDKARNISGSVTEAILNRFNQ